jgi:hypothetical protein
VSCDRHTGATAFRAVEAARPLQNGAAMWKAIALISLASACSSLPDEATIRDRHVEGDYDLAYTPASGQPIVFQRGPTVFQDPAQEPQRCLTVLRRTASTLEIVVGNYVDSGGAVAQLHLYVDGVVAEGAQTVALDGARLVVSYDANDLGEHFLLPHSTNVVTEVAVTGELDLQQLQCLDAPDELGCALVADGDWTFESADGSVQSSGSFHEVDTTSQQEL